MAVASLQVVGGTPAIPPALLYSDSNNKGFLINPGEGIQRLILESPGLRIGNITDIITTHTSWETCASIPGIALFRRDQFASKASINPLNTWTSEEISNFLKITQKECFADEVSVDRHLKIHDISELYNLGSIMVQSFKMISSYALYFKLPQKSGKVSQKILKELNIPQKYLSDLFKKGKIVLENGREISKDDVTETPTPPPAFVVINCSSLKEVDLLNKINFARCGEETTSQLTVLCHFTPESIIKSDEYNRFLKKYKDFDHLWLTRNSKSEILSDCRERNMILSSISPVKKLHDEEEEEEGYFLDLVPCQHLLKYHLYSGRKTPVGWNTSNVIKRHNIDTSNKESFAMRAYEKFKEKHSSAVNPEPKKQKTVPLTFPEILFLGTTSTYSSTYRNVSSILCTSPSFSFMLDSGEFTAGQLIRAYGMEGALEMIKRLKFLYISHIHFDHCGGALEIARLYHQATKKALVILCPSRAIPWFECISGIFEIPLDLISLGSIASGSNGKLNAVAEGNFFIDLCSARHTRDAWCVVIRTELWKIAYSGDTMPTEDLVDIGKNCDLLIHEATHQSSLLNDATAKRHSTVGQAIEISEKMKASFTVLTHFSLRYQKMPPIVNEKIPANVAFAHDFMFVTPSNIQTWCEFTKVLPEIFPVEYQDLIKSHYRRK